MSELEKFGPEGRWERVVTALDEIEPGWRGHGTDAVKYIGDTAIEAIKNAFYALKKLQEAQAELRKKDSYWVGSYTERVCCTGLVQEMKDLLRDYHAKHHELYNGIEKYRAAAAKSDARWNENAERSDAWLRVCNALQSGIYPKDGEYPPDCGLMSVLRTVKRLRDLDKTCMSAAPLPSLGSLLPPVPCVSVPELRHAIIRLASTHRKTAIRLLNLYDAEEVGQVPEGKRADLLRDIRFAQAILTP